MSDTISDFITIIRNASRAGKETCAGRLSKVHHGLCRILKSEGFIRDYSEDTDKNGHPRLVLQLKYVEGTPSITDIQRHSKPGKRLYYKANEIPIVLDGLGVAIVTTSQGLMTDREARRRKMGGEVLCTIW